MRLITWGFPRSHFPHRHTAAVNAGHYQFNAACVHSVAGGFCKPCCPRRQLFHIVCGGLPACYGMFDMNGGAVLALFLLLPTLAAYLIQRYWISNKSFVTVTGKPTQRRKLYEPYIVWPLFAFCPLFHCVGGTVRSSSRRRLCLKHGVLTTA